MFRVFIYENILHIADIYHEDLADVVSQFLEAWCLFSDFLIWK